jgi:anti-sigma regulatory factor (Ser/Thr protein kinase)
MTDLNRRVRVTDAALTLCDAASARTVAQFRYELSQWLSAHFTLGALRRNDVLLAVNEALTNVAEFAYRGRTGIMTLRARHRTADGALVVDVTDNGSWRHTNPATRSNTRGRGIPLMRALADSATILPTAAGTEVRLQFNDFARVGASQYTASL